MSALASADQFRVGEEAVQTTKKDPKFNLLITLQYHQFSKLLIWSFICSRLNSWQRVEFQPDVTNNFHRKIIFQIRHVLPILENSSSPFLPTRESSTSAYIKAKIKPGVQFVQSVGHSWSHHFDKLDRNAGVISLSIRNIYKEKKKVRMC